VSIGRRNMKCLYFVETGFTGQTDIIVHSVLNSSQMNSTWFCNMVEVNHIWEHVCIVFSLIFLVRILLCILR
jgi:hypothetical protein